MNRAQAELSVCSLIANILCDVGCIRQMNWDDAKLRIFHMRERLLGLLGARNAPTSCPSTTLADLLPPLLVANPFSAMRASLRRWRSDEFEDGGGHGGKGRLGGGPGDV